jgi:hypothetical protein
MLKLPPDDNYILAETHHPTAYCNEDNIIPAKCIKPTCYFITLAIFLPTPMVSFFVANRSIYNMS